MCKLVYTLILFKAKENNIGKRKTKNEINSERREETAGPQIMWYLPFTATYKDYVFMFR